MFIAMGLILAIFGPPLDLWAGSPVPWWSFYVACFILVLVQWWDPLETRRAIRMQRSQSRFRHPSMQDPKPDPKSHKFGRQWP